MPPSTFSKKRSLSPLMSLSATALIQLVGFLYILKQDVFKQHRRSRCALVPITILRSNASGVEGGRPHMHSGRVAVVASRSHQVNGVQCPRAVRLRRLCVHPRLSPFISNSRRLWLIISHSTDLPLRPNRIFGSGRTVIR